MRSCMNSFKYTLFLGKEPTSHRDTSSTDGPACYGEGDRSLDEIVADASCGTGGDEAAGAILDEASPAFTGISFVGGSVFLRTKDQNSSISTVERWRSCVKIFVKASACSPARRSHWPIVSYLWPVISSAARRLPRRITTRSA